MPKNETNHKVKELQLGYYVDETSIQISFVKRLSRIPRLMQSTKE